MLEFLAALPVVALSFVVIVVVGFFVYIFLKLRYKKAGPEEALIIYGKRKFFGKRQMRTAEGEIQEYRIVRGGGTIIWPGWENFQRLSLKIMTLEIDLHHVYTVQGIPINVKAVAQVKVKSDLDHIRRAAEGFLGIPFAEIQATIKETVAGHLRGIVGTLTVEKLYRDQKSFQEKIRDEAHRDLDGMGFEFKSFTFQEIQDDEGYLNALGQPEIQTALKEARVATAQADRDAKLEEETARKDKEAKRLAVDNEVQDSERTLSLKKASIKKEVDVAQAQAVKAGEMELKLQDIKIADQEVERQKLELNAIVREKADAEKYRVEREADAGKYRTEQEAAADRRRREEAAEAVKAEGLAEAAAEAAKRRDVGLAEAEAVKAKGEAEAEARRLLAEALKLYNEAGLSIEALKVLPEIAAAVAEPLSRAGSTTIISNGGAKGSGTGASKLSEDAIQVMGQLSPILKQLSGVELEDFLKGLAALPGAAAARLSADTSTDAGEEAPKAKG